MDPLAFEIGAASTWAARILAIGVGVYAVLTASHTVDAYRRHLADRGSSLLATWVMIGLSILLWEQGARLLPAPFSVVVIATYFVGITITLGWTLSNAEKRFKQWRDDLEELLDEFARKALPDHQREAWVERKWLQLHPEQKRKTPHLMMGLFVAGYAFLGYWILRGIQTWLPATGNEAVTNVHIALSGGWMAAGHMVAITALLGLLMLLLPVEMVRLRFPDLDYPFKGTITSMLRERERGLFGAHYYIAATLPLAVLWLTEDTTAWDRTLFAVLAMLGVTVFADAASALVGIRFGKRRWSHNQNKTLMGTAGGCAVAFLVSIPFVGLPMAIATAVVFYVVDVLAPVPVSVSDNILNPLALAATYIVLQDHLAPMIPFY